MGNNEWKQEIIYVLYSCLLCGNHVSRWAEEWLEWVNILSDCTLDVSHAYFVCLSNASVNTLHFERGDKSLLTS